MDCGGWDMYVSVNMYKYNATPSSVTGNFVQNQVAIGIFLLPLGLCCRAVSVRHGHIRVLCRNG